MTKHYVTQVCSLLLNKINSTHKDFITELNKRYLKKKVTLVTNYPPEANGREAIIDHIVIEKGIPLFLCMVLKRNTETIYLNSKNWTRQYRPAPDFIIHVRTD